VSYEKVQFGGSNPLWVWPLRFKTAARGLKMVAVTTKGVTLET